MVLMSSSESSFLPRSRTFSRPKLVTGPKLVGALLHLLIAPTVGYLLRVDAGSILIAWFGTLIGRDFSTAPVQGNRIMFYTLMSYIYSIRWGAIGMFTSNGGGCIPWRSVLPISNLHFLVQVIPFVVLSVTRGGLSPTLDILDSIAACLMILAGIMQQGAELQRLAFKLDPTNKGKLHTTGLFGMARYINHAGHVLQEVAMALTIRSWSWFAWAIFVGGYVFTALPKEMDAHMRSKYGEKYEIYCQQTPYKFVPYVY